MHTLKLSVKRMHIIIYVNYCAGSTYLKMADLLESSDSAIQLLVCKVSDFKVHSGGARWRVEAMGRFVSACIGKKSQNSI